MKKFASISQLGINILSGLTTTGLNVVVMAVSYPVYLYYLGYDKTGVWLLLSSVQMFAQLGLLGIGPALTKLVAEERGRGNQNGAQSYISLAMASMIATSLLALAILLIFRKGIVAGMGVGESDSIAALRLLPWVGVLTAFGFLNQVTVSALAGVGRIDLANYDASAGKVIALVVEMILLHLGGGLATLLIGDFVGCVVIQVAGAVQLRRTAGLRLLGPVSWDADRVRRLLSFGGAMFVASIATLLVSPLNKWALARYAGVALVPVYDIAFNGSMQLRGLVEVGLRALMPAISHRMAAADPEATTEIRHLYRRTLGWLLLILPVGYGCAVLAAPMFFRLWLRHRFVPEIVPAFDIIFGSAVISLLAVPAFFVLMGSGRVNSCMVSHLLSAAANVICVAAIVARYGTMSIQTVSFAVLATMVTSSVYLLYRAHVALQPERGFEVVVVGAGTLAGE